MYVNSLALGGIPWEAVGLSEGYYENMFIMIMELVSLSDIMKLDCFMSPKCAEKAALN